MRVRAGVLARLNPESSHWALGHRLPAQPGTAPQDRPGLGQGEPTGPAPGPHSSLAAPPSASWSVRAPAGSKRGPAKETALLQPRSEAPALSSSAMTGCTSNCSEMLPRQLRVPGQALASLPQNSRMSENRKEKRSLRSVWWAERSWEGEGWGRNEFLGTWTDATRTGSDLTSSTLHPPPRSPCFLPLCRKGPTLHQTDQETAAQRGKQFARRHIAEKQPEAGAPDP